MKTAMPAAVKTEPGALDGLLAAVARGDREALASLYRETHAAVYGFSLSIQDNNGPQVVEFDLVICAYDPGTDREGYQDVCNIKEDIVQCVCAKPYFGGVFTVLKPVAWAIQQDTSPPYYFGAVVLNCTAPALNQDAAMAELV